MGPLARRSRSRRASGAPAPAPGGYRVAFLIYRGNPRCGGQGVYTRHLTRELVALGHSVEVFSGPPWPELDEGVGFTPVRGLDLYRDPDPFRIPARREFTSLADVAEFAVMLSGGFGEPLAFSLRIRQDPARAARRLRHRPRQPVHGHRASSAAPRRLAAARDAAPPDHRGPLDRARPRRRRAWKRFTTRRWFGFLRMQVRVVRSVCRRCSRSRTTPRPTSTPRWACRSSA